MCSLVGTEVEAITLQTGGVDFTEGLTGNYLKVRMPGRWQANRWMRLRVQRVEGEMLVADAVVPFVQGERAE